MNSSVNSSPLANREFRELWAANAMSNFGGQIQVVGAAWLMFNLTESAQMTALVQSATSLPTMLFILLGGALADNFNRRKIMLVTQSSMLIVALVLAFLSWNGLTTPWMLLGLVFVSSIFGSLNNPSWQASVRDILPRELISRAVGLNSISINLARTGGPALGGVIVAAASVAAAFIANAVSFVIFLVALLRWKPAPKLRNTPREQLFSAMIAGVRYAARDRNVRNAVLRGGISGVSASAAFALLPVLVRDTLDGNALAYGLILAAFGGGAVISAGFAATLRSNLTPDRVVLLGTIALTIGLALLAVAPSFLVAAIGAALCGSGWTTAHSTYNTTVQLSASTWVTARSLALYQTATFAGMAVGSAALGWVAEHQDVGTAFYVAAAAQLFAGALGFILPLPRLQDLNVEMLNQWTAPILSVEVQPDEGPIRVEIEYVIAEQNSDRFLSAMEFRANIRKRDGARNWALWQDLSERTRWIESYRVHHWAEYLRHNSRRTEADREYMETLDALHSGEEIPAIRRYIWRD